MKRVSIIIAIILILVLLCCTGIFLNKKYKGRSQVISDENFLKLSVTERYTLPSTIDEEAFTCTGLSYDYVNNSLWVGNYGASDIEDINKFPSIIELDYNSLEIKQIIELPFLDATTANIQGVAYDDENDSIWFTDSSKIYQINKNGDLLFEFSVYPYEESVPNGVACGNDGSLWILFCSDYLINYTKDGKEINIIECNYENQDHIVCDENGKIWISVGADYLGENNYVIQIDSVTGEIVAGFIVSESYAVEGISFVGGKLLVLNDGLYHAAKIKENYICTYNLE